MKRTGYNLLVLAALIFGLVVMTRIGLAAEPNDTNRPDKEKSSAPRRQRSERNAENEKSEDQEPADPNEPKDMLEAVNLNNIEMKHIVQKIADWTQKPVIPTSDEVMKVKISIYSPKKVPRAEALSLIISALHAKGVVMDELEDKIFLRPLASVRLGSVPTLGSDEPLARILDKTTIVEKWFALKSYSPSQLIQIINPLIAEYGYAIADEATMQVAVIDTVENLMRIERLIQQVDIPESGQEVEKIFELQYADPLEVVQVLELILGQQGGGRNNNRRNTPRASAPQSKDAKSAMTVVISSTVTPIRLIPMTKQRWVLVRASRDDMTKIEGWIKKLDIVDSDELKQVVIQVRYADVREVARMVESTIQEMPGTDMEANIVVESLPQSGQIVVYGSEANRKIVERLIAQIDLPSADVYEEETFKLKHADPDTIKKNIDELYGEEQAGRNSYYYYRYGAGSRGDDEDTVKVISYPMLKQVTVIASAPNLKKIKKQIEEWDKPLDIEADQYRILFLRNSDPVQMATLLQKLFSEDSGSGDSRSLFRMLFYGEGGDSRKKIVGSLYGTLTFEPVPGTKKLMVISKIPEAYDVIERLVKKLDSQEMAEVPRVVTLNYADAEDLCEQLNAILNEPGTPATIRRKEQGLSAYSPGDQETGQQNATPENDPGSMSLWWERQRLDRTQMPSSNLIGQIRFVPVHRSKAILVLAPPEYIEEIEAMIHQLDKPGMQVMIKAVIADIGLSDVSSLGVQLASDPSAFGTLGVNALTALNELSYLDAGTSFSFAYGSDIHVLLDLLVKHANGRILNQPTLWTKDNEEAIFVKGQKIAFIETDNTDSSNLGNTKRTFDYQDVGVTLRIRPNITPERAVDMTINLNISEVEDELINTQVARKNLDTTTHLIVNDGQSIMMGGILEQNDGTVVQKVPLLGDLPLLGALFRHEKKDITNTELLIFITPYVIDDQTLDQIPADETTKDEFLNQSRMKLNEIVDSLSRSVMQLSEDPNDIFVGENRENMTEKP